MTWNIEVVKLRQEVASATLNEKRCNSAVKRAIKEDLPGAIELLEEAENLLLDARPVIGGESEADWCKRREAFFAKIRPQTKQEGI